MGLAKALVRPPMRLRTLPDRWVALLRALWIAASVAAAAAVILGTVHALRDTYEVRPEFTSLGLDYDVANDGSVVVAAASPGAAVESTQDLRIVAINGARVPDAIRTQELARRLAAAKGPAVTLDLRSASGKIVRLDQKRETLQVDASASRYRDLRVAARMSSGLLACGTLLLCSLLLALRRPDDPVALLFAFAFAGMAGTIDPPLAMWMAMGWPVIYDVISSLWYYLLLIGLATFPDGIFVPRPYRWLLLCGIALAIFVSLPAVDANLQVLVGIGALLAVLLAQVRRYRRLQSGIERQQIKWAAFGFAAGFALLSAAFVMLLFFPAAPVRPNPILTVSIVLCFSLGMAAIPLGLLIALTRFRLWEADTIITRSAAYAVVTIIVGVVWAASSDLVKMLVSEVVGRESEAGATTVSAIIAAGIFSPTQSIVLGWTRRRFGGPVDRIQGAAKRLKSWGLTETPDEIATRALSIIDEAIHPSVAAIVMDTAQGGELLATRGTDSADDRRLIESIALADEESSVGTLRLGRRSDGNRYNRQELEAVRELVPSLAEALRVARGRHSRESVMQQQLEAMAARLAQLEGGAPKPV